MTWPKSEVELARIVVEDLRARGWEIYQEVETFAGGPRLDIVAAQGPVLWGVEVKRSLGLAVLAQADAWVGKAHLVSVAVPRGRHSNARRFALKSAAASGIGVLEVCRQQRLDAEGWEHRVREAHRPRFHRRAPGSLRAALRPEHKTYAEAGNAGSKRFTKFQATARAAVRVLRRRGPLHPRELVEDLRGSHHYANEASARGSLLSAARAGLMPGVEARQFDGRWVLDVTE